MKVCDMCRERIQFPDTVTIKNIISIRYEVCGKCANKLNKYIRYEAARHKRSDNNAK